MVQTLRQLTQHLLTTEEAVVYLLVTNLHMSYRTIGTALGMDGKTVASMYKSAVKKIERNN